MTLQVHKMAREIFILASGWRLWDHSGSLEEMARESINAAHEFYKQRQIVSKEDRNADNNQSHTK